MLFKIEFPEMLEWDWVKELPDLQRNSQFVSRSRLLSEIPPVPVERLLRVLKDALSRPEIVNASMHPESSEERSEKSRHILMWFREYIRHKYGNEDSALLMLSYYLPTIVNGHYQGIDDPKLHDDMRNCRGISYPNSGSDPGFVGDVTE